MLWSNNYASVRLIKIPGVNIFQEKLDSSQNGMAKRIDLEIVRTLLIWQQTIYHCIYYRFENTSLF